MKRTTIRELKHATSAVLQRVASGEMIEVCRRDEPVAVLSPPVRKTRVSRPDFAARLRDIYGAKVLEMTGSDLVSASRGEA